MVEKILIVEDEPLMLKFLDFRLAKSGYDIRVAQDGREAEEYIDNEPFSLIIMDLMIPFVSGLELLGKKREKAHNKNTPVLIISSYTQESIIMEGLSLGADDFIPKPIDVENLTTKVRVLLNKYKIAV